MTSARSCRRSDSAERSCTMRPRQFCMSMRSSTKREPKLLQQGLSLPFPVRKRFDFRMIYLLLGSNFIEGSVQGRSPNDKCIVDERSSRDDVWWGPVNISLENQVRLYLKSMLFERLSRLCIIIEFHDKPGTCH